ncbi:MAG TPA: diaminopimelate decarboxylase [Candidatus Elarobacter sp.]|nr:diaminopimelate decarboxylase [Candidatus Elarobacter sp.]
MGEGVLTERGYARSDGVLTCEGVSLETIAERVGTPAYVYSAAIIRDRYTRLADALGALPVHIHFSVKANSSLAILSLLRSLGAGVDIVSGGELHRALAAGFSGGDIVFSGVGKTERELEEAIRVGVASINVESEGELELIDLVATRLGTTARVALRVNPDVAVDTPHPYTRTGELGMKFGIPRDRVLDVARRTASMPHVELIGLATHIGSQISQAEPYALAVKVLLSLKHAIEREGVAVLRTLDAGGGLAVTYDRETSPDLRAYAAALAPLAASPGVRILIEPGRFLVAESGVLLARVLYRKHSGGTEIVITDAGMNDLIRPALYESHHRIDVVGGQDDETVRANIVGPVCESGDFFARDREIPSVQPGELLALRTVGAYGYVMASNYNSRPRPAEVLVDGDRFAVITARETLDDLIGRETLTPTWMDG